MGRGSRSQTPFPCTRHHGQGQRACACTAPQRAVPSAPPRPRSLINVGHACAFTRSLVRCISRVGTVGLLTVRGLCLPQHLDENSPLGDLLRGVLDVPACQIGEPPAPSLPLRVTQSLVALFRPQGRKPMAGPLKAALTLSSPHSWIHLTPRLPSSPLALTPACSPCAGAVEGAAGELKPTVLMGWSLG